jgi:hypothetical protein
MHQTLADLIKAGALTSLCTYHAKIGGRHEDWPAVHVFALREFRMQDPAIVEQLVNMAAKARECAATFAASSKKTKLDKATVPGSEFV